MSVNTNSVCLTWGAPEGPIRPPKYRVTWRSEADLRGDLNCGSLAVAGQQVRIYNLTPGEKYAFTVASLYDDDSQSPCVSATVHTGMSDLGGHIFDQINSMTTVCMTNVL